MSTGRVIDRFHIDVFGGVVRLTNQDRIKEEVELYNEDEVSIMLIPIDLWEEMVRYVTVQRTGSTVVKDFCCMTDEEE